MNSNNFIHDRESGQLSLLALETALLRFMIGLNDENKNNVEKWIDKNAAEPTFLEDLIVAYPDFGNIMIEEINVAKKHFLTL